LRISDRRDLNRMADKRFIILISIGYWKIGAVKKGRPLFLLGAPSIFCLARVSQKPGFIGLDDAPQHRGLLRPGQWFSGRWQPAESHLYIEPDERDFPSQAAVHRPLKKSDFLAFFAFDLPEPRTYNPRPRCFAADVAKRVIPLNSDVKTVGRSCLTL
jgi:hypothetical protein